MNVELSIAEYSEIVSRLPIPTREQTKCFADHVADNHSWYKHLPFFPPGACFVLFINPHAGCNVRRSEESFIVRDIDRGDYFEHHSRLSTKDYRDRYGNWDYWVDDYPRLADSQAGPWIYEDGNITRKLLPLDLKRRWNCRLTAFLKPSPVMFRLRQHELQRELAAFLDLVSRRRPEATGYHDMALVVRDLDFSDSLNASFLENARQMQRKILAESLNAIRAELESVVENNE